MEAVTLHKKKKKLAANCWVTNHIPALKPENWLLPKPFWYEIGLLWFYHQ